MDINNQSDEFKNIREECLEIKGKLKIVNQQKRELDSNLRNLTKKLQKNCKHFFIKEETTSGCYREYNNICSIYGLWA